MAPDKIKFDLENGNANEEKRREEGVANDEGGNDEYSNLVRYISTYRDGRRRSMSVASVDPSGEEADKDNSKGFFSFMKRSQKSSTNEFVAPEEWLFTDLKAGLNEATVEQRRKKAGFNELTTEKENMFIKFLMYFTGPILYGEFFCYALATPRRFGRVDGPKLTNNSHGNCRCLGRWSTGVD